MKTIDFTLNKEHSLSGKHFSKKNEKGPGLYCDTPLF